MERMHNLLKRQMRKYMGSVSAHDKIQLFIDAVNDAYHQSDTDRAMLEHVLELSSNELLLANAELNAVFQAIPDLFLILGFTGEIIDSRGGEQDAAYVPPEKLIGRHICDILTEIKEEKFKEAAGAARDARAMTLYEYSLLIDDIETFYEARLLLLSDNKLLMVIQNITQRKMSESRESALQQKLTDAERRNSLGVLAGGVAHDLNNVLGPLVLLPELIEDILAKADGAGEEDMLFVKESMAVIKSSARRAAETVKDLKVLGDRGPVTLKPMDANTIAQDVLSTHEAKELIGEHPDAIVDCELYDGKITVLANKNDLYRVLFNLVMNAIESISQSGHVQIQTDLVSLSEPAIGYETVEVGDYVVFRICDTGHGIDDKVYQRVFEPFVTTKKITGGKSGSGLGLSVVHSIVKSSNGFMDVTREADGWSTIFSIYLPAEVRNYKAEKAHASEPRFCNGSDSVLVVDDEHGQRFAARCAFKKCGYEVSEASHGREAVEIVKERQSQGEAFSLILLDMSMEDDFDGLDTYEALLALNPNQSVIIASGHAISDRIKAAMDLGAGWLPKPYTVESLARELTRLFDSGK